MEDYPKVIQVGTARYTVKSADEEARYRQSGVEPNSIDVVAEPSAEPEPEAIEPAPPKKVRKRPAVRKAAKKPSSRATRSSRSKGRRKK